MKDINDTRTIDIVSAHKRVGRPVTSSLSKLEQRAEAQRRYRAKIKSDKAKQTLQAYVAPDTMARLAEIKREHDFTNQGEVIDFLVRSVAK